jgi:hypothetical protein
VDAPLGAVDNNKSIKAIRRASASSGACSFRAAWAGEAWCGVDDVFSDNGMMRRIAAILHVLIAPCEISFAPDAQFISFSVMEHAEYVCEHVAKVGLAIG